MDYQEGKVQVQIHSSEYGNIVNIFSEDLDLLKRLEAILKDKPFVTEAENYIGTPGLTLYHAVSKEEEPEFDIEDLAEQLYRLAFYARRDDLRRHKWRFNIPLEVWTFLVDNYPEWYVDNRSTQVFGGVTITSRTYDKNKAANNVRIKMSEGLFEIPVGLEWIPVAIHIDGEKISLSSKE